MISPWQRLKIYEQPHDKPTKWPVRPAKPQISLGIRTVWSESSLCTQWVAKDPSFLHADSEDWSDWADAQADLSLRWVHRSFCWFCHDSTHIFWLQTSHEERREENKNRKAKTDPGHYNATGPWDIWWHVPRTDWWQSSQRGKEETMWGLWGNVTTVNIGTPCYYDCKLWTCSFTSWVVSERCRQIREQCSPWSDCFLLRSVPILRNHKSMLWE